MTRERACGAPEARVRAAVARRYLDVADLTAGEEDAAAWHDVAVGNAVLAGIAASDALCCARLGRRSRDADHRAAIDLLSQVDERLGRDLDRLLQVKDVAHYGVDLISEAKSVVVCARPVVSRTRPKPRCVPDHRLDPGRARTYSYGSAEHIVKRVRV
jgi:hypothetical protein